MTILYSDNSNKLELIKIGVSDYNAGAVTSLIYKGKEFVDDLDHGRQWQSAFSVGLGEMINPTEAGSVIDGDNPSPSSSKLINYSIENNRIKTRNQMAYWHPWNGRAISDVYFEKDITINSNHIIWKTKFEVPHNTATHGIFEVLTGYMPKCFDTFGRLINGKASISEKLDIETGDPLLIGTGDLQYCVAVYTDGIPQAGIPFLGYGQFVFGDCNKWNTVYRTSKPYGTFEFTTYIAIGDIYSVIDTINKFVKK